MQSTIQDYMKPAIRWEYIRAFKRIWPDVIFSSRQNNYYFTNKSINCFQSLCLSILLPFPLPLSLSQCLVNFQFFISQFFYRLRQVLSRSSKEKLWELLEHDLFGLELLDALPCDQPTVSKHWRYRTNTLSTGQNVHNDRSWAGLKWKSKEIQAQHYSGKLHKTYKYTYIYQHRWP